MKRLLTFFLFCVLGVVGTLAQHPKLLLTKEELGYMKQHMNEVPAFGRVVDDLVQKLMRLVLQPYKFLLPSTEVEV